MGVRRDAWRDAWSAGKEKPNCNNVKTLTLDGTRKTKVKCLRKKNHRGKHSNGFISW